MERRTSSAIRLVSFVTVIALVSSVATTNADFIFGTPTEVPNVNSPSDDIQPDITADGLSLYFVSSRPYETSYLDVSRLDIWVATRETTDDDWGAPVRLGPPVNTSACEVDPSVSTDGLELYFCDGVMNFSGYTRPGGYGDVDIWVSTRATVDDPWGEPQNLGPIVNTSRFEGDPEISGDGLSLFFHGHRPGGYGTCDIWVTTRATREDDWGPPLNLGPAVNSSSGEIDPGISPDGLAFFFCASRVGGYGAGDIWLAARASSSMPWELPINLGPLVNTFIDEADPSISADARTLYFDRGVWPTGSTWDLWQAPIIPIVDFNGDGTVDSTEVYIMVDHWDARESLCDIAPMPWGDGIVDVEDLRVLAEYMDEPVDDPTLIAHWALDETEDDIAYDSACENDAVLLGGATWQPEGGTVAGALEFKGVDGWVDTPSVLNPADGPFSVLLWVKGDTAGQVMLSQSGGHDWLLTDASGVLMTDLKGTGRKAKALYSQTVITDGQWHRVGLTWDGLNRGLCVDGVMVAEDEPSLLPDIRVGLHIGCGANLEPGSFFSGLIDDVRIYKRTVRP
ncbi:MAG: PD40 domain-containing protein [Phycisphaerales bacterium]|nr:MAG: PD40 domain-containing protein [Phycisphaerales bacterium]